MLKTIQKYAITASTTASAFVASTATAFAQRQGIPLRENIDPGTGFATDFGSLINAVLSFVMVIAALLVFLYLIWGGIQWITSGGDKGKTEEARNKITAAILGLIVLAASYAVLLIALRFLGFENLQDVFRQTRTIS
jgi:cytochrome bd-type quinol oxidase subunit 2